MDVKIGKSIEANLFVEGMVKKNFSFSIAALLLIGCGKEDSIITKQWLNSNWSCNLNQYQYSNVLGKFGDIISSKHINFSYKVINDELFQIEENGEKIKINEDRINNINSFHYDNEFFELNGTVMNKKLSKNKFIEILDQEEHSFETDVRSKLRTEMTCVKVKQENFLKGDL